MTIAAQNADTARRRLVEIAGQENLLVGEQAAPYSLGGEQPVGVVFPADESQLAEIAGMANALKVPVVLWGGGTKQEVEPVQPRDGIVLGTTRLTSLDLDSANLTVTVGAGMVVDDLQRELAKARLFLPLDPVDSARSTVGGMLAANTSGPNRLLYRTARDMVLGLRVVTSLGAAIRVGGKTVKDVAGYDMKKLYLGSWGTLGAITEATFRLLPLPEASATVGMVFPTLSGGCATVSSLLTSFLIPSAADLLSYGAMPASVEQAFDLQPGEYLLLVSFEGAVEAVERQKREMLELATKQGLRTSTLLEGEGEKQLWRQRKQVFAQMPAGEPSMLVKGSVLLKRVFDFTNGLSSLGLQIAFAAHAGNGVVYALVSTGAGQEQKLAAAAERIQRLAGDCGGFALVQKAPRAVSEKVQLWPPRSDYGLMRGIKAQLDPNNLWNPARIPGGSR